MKHQVKEYHFDFGNSSKGVIGMCAVVRAHSKAEAVEILREALPETVENVAEGDGIVYVNVYLNPDNVKERQIEEVTPC